MNQDPYQVLGLSPDATEEEVAKAYRKLAKVYHPDVNHGSPEAAKKMSEINAAYDLVKSGKASHGYDSSGEGGQGDGPSASSEASDPFGFNPFEAFFGGAGYGDGAFDSFGRGGYGQSLFAAVRNYLGMGNYAAALKALNSIADKNAEWYYLSALANSGCGNADLALQHAKTAVQMESDNLEYRRVLSQMQNGGRVYQQQSRSYRPTFSLSKILLGLFFFDLIFRIFARLFF
jgi:molecular chaperone DnaJ